MLLNGGNITRPTERARYSDWLLVQYIQVDIAVLHGLSVQLESQRTPISSGSRDAK